MGMKTNHNAMDEYVMVLPADSLWKAGYFQGLTFAIERYMHLIKDKNKTIVLKRKDVETDANYKQIIPYAIFFHGGKIFSYRRGKLLEEKRLLGDYSIGIGGHISSYDDNLFMETYEHGMLREIYEEVRISSSYSQHLVAMINDDTNEVGRVHFGIVHMFYLNQAEVEPKEKSINEGRFVSILNLKSNIDKYENWSQICIQNIDNLIEFNKRLEMGR